MARFLRIELGACLLGALCLYFLPFRWVIGVLTAGAIHEMGHLLALFLQDVSVHCLILDGFGAKIDTGPLERKQELLCALAGPFGSFAAILLCPFFPEAALCGVVQGFFNLIPLYPLDGGRALRCVLPDRHCDAVEKVTIVLLLLLGSYAAFVLKFGPAVCVPVLALVLRSRKRKKPCNKMKKAVQ